MSKKSKAKAQRKIFWPQGLIFAATPVRFFIIISFLFGLILLLITPPFQGGDEPLHFYRSYQISTMNFLVDENEGHDYGGILPTSLQKTVALTTNNSSLGNLKPDEKYSLHTTKQALSIKEQAGDKQWTNFTATALYPPVAYAPQAFGILIARVLHQSPIIMMYLGRLMNLAVWILLLAVSIRLIPAKKWAVVFLGLLPVALSQASSLSADVMTLGLFAIFFSYILRTMSSKDRISSKKIVVLLLLVIAMVLCKQVTVVLLPLVLLIPNKTFQSTKYASLLKAILITIPIIAYGVWMYLIRNVDMKSVFSHHQNPSEQIKFVIHNPLSFIHTLWNTNFLSTGDSITKSFIGTFGWGDVGLSVLVITIGYIGLFLVLVANPTAQASQWLTKKQKALLVAVGLAYWAAVSAALYAYYNPVGSKVIAGLQGRYFWPLGIIAIPLLYGEWLKTNKKSYKLLVIYLPFFLLVASVVTIYSRYYINGI